MRKSIYKVFSLILLGVCSCGLIACESDPKSVSFTLDNVEGAEIHTEHQAAFLADSNYSNIGKYSAFAEKSS